MKKILIIIVLCFGFSSYCQTAPEYFNRGKDKYDLKDYQGAIADYSKSIELAPDYVKTYFLRGFAKYDLKDYRGAIADFSIAIEKNPNYKASYFARGLSKLKLNQKDSACLDLSKAGELGYDKAYEFIKDYCN